MSDCKITNFYPMFNYSRCRNFIFNFCSALDLMTTADLITAVIYRDIDFVARYLDYFLITHESLDILIDDNRESFNGDEYIKTIIDAVIQHEQSLDIIFLIIRNSTMQMLDNTKRALLEKDQQGVLSHYESQILDYLK